MFRGWPFTNSTLNRRSLAHSLVEHDENRYTRTIESYKLESTTYTEILSTD